jgi:hypothetical protein
VTSQDGTRIAFERVGNGPSLILVDGALCRRAFGPMRPLSAELSTGFSVFYYDRRGRDDSGDSAQYTVAREIEDLAALIEAAGGSAYVFGASSGAALALEAAAAGLPIRKLAMYEPPYVAGDTQAQQPDHRARLLQLLAAGKRAAAVRYFMRDMVQVPAFALVMMQLMFPIFSKLKAAAHTLPYDAAIMGNWSVPVARAAQIHVPTLIANGSKTDERLKRAATVIAQAIVGAEHRELPGQTHNASAAALAPVLAAFFNADAQTSAATAAVSAAR